MATVAEKVAYIKSEHDRWTRMIGPADPYLTKVTIGIHEVLHAHFLLAEFFAAGGGEGMGGIGPKDSNLLHSALGRQFVQFGGKPKWNDRIEICATLMYGLVKNHAFHDANKRTAFLASILHLQKIGRTPIATHLEYEDFTVAIADNKLQPYGNLPEDQKLNSDEEIGIITRFLKKKTRQIDLRSKLITYNQLNTILHGRGMTLANPNGNRIDLMRVADTDGNKITPKRIAHVGFHGWSREVGPPVIDIVREASRLDARHGFDSQAFYNGLEDPLTLIRKYKEPLERLAFR